MCYKMRKLATMITKIMETRMRAFLGLAPDPQTILAIERWRNKALPYFTDAVPPANYHITLAFLGPLNHRQQDDLRQRIDTITDIPTFQLNLTILGYWPKPKALWLGCQQIAKSHQVLVNKLTNSAKIAGIAMQNRDYQAHITLIRKCHENPPAPLIEPNFKWQAHEFHLYESVSTS